MMQYAISFRGAVMSAAAIAAVASIAVPAPSIAGQPGAVVVTATTAEWSGAVSRELESRLAALVDPPLQHRRVPTGVVSVRFRTDENGAPTGIEIARTSGSAALDGIGKRAVARLATLPPLPAGLSGGQVFEANIVVAADRREHDRQLAVLRQRQETRRAAGADGDVLALNVGYDSSARGG